VGWQMWQPKTGSDSLQFGAGAVALAQIYRVVMEASIIAIACTKTHIQSAA